MSYIAASEDTIVAVATPFGRGGIGILRLSGPKAVVISQRLIRGAFPKPRVATYREFLNAEGIVLDQGIILYFQKPHSFTGEDVVEFQGHGSPPILNALLMSAVSRGARLAKPGEFSQRAFFNNRLDLAQAEAIADLVQASSEKAAQAAMRSLQGVFSEKVNDIHQDLVKLRATVEASIDFSEEGVESLTTQSLIEHISHIIGDIQHLQKEARQAQRLQEGMQLIIAGPPNAGKSSLLNILSGEETAIVSPIAGTTRDIVTADITIDGLPIHILDTAGLRVTKNAVEREGIRRTLKAIEKADQILWVVDSVLPESQIAPQKLLDLLGKLETPAKIAIVRNKIDLTHEPSGVTLDREYDTIRLSLVEKKGITELKAYLKKSVGYNSEEIGFSARARHISALVRCETRLKEGLSMFDYTSDLEIISVHLKEAHETICEITGLFTTEDLLGNIFSSFCIGK